MWTVLLVEDEAFVRRMVRSSMQWEAKGFQVIGEADNGEDALELIRKYRPHLVVTDIMMPRMTGVELLKQARQEGYDCRFVMLSVMDDFQYVQQALEYGASNYILKLYLSVEKMHEVLDKVGAELKKMMATRSRDMDGMYEQIWRRLLDKWKGETVPPNEHEEAGGLPSEKCMIIHLIHGKSNFTMESFIALGIVEPEAAPYIHLFHGLGQTTAFFWIPPSASAAAAKPKTPTWSHGIAVYTSVAPTNLDILQDAWEKACRRADDMWYAGKTGVFALGAHLDTRVEPVQTWEQEREMIYSLEHKRPDGCKTHIGRLWEQFRSARQPAALVIETAERLDKLFALITGRSPSRQGDRPLAVSHDELREVMDKRVDASIQGWLREQVDLTDHPEINKVIQYIRENYASDISVTFLSEYVAMDDKYLSGLFKKKTGYTMVHYIQHVRIEQARFYLEHTDWPIAEVGSKVGFANENYFAKIFRRLTDMTPSAYRQHKTGK